MIIAEGLKKTYVSSIKRGFFKSETKKTEAVKGLDIIVQPGKIVGLLGINGAGKTTTIKMLSTLLEPDAGKCNVDGMDLVKDARKIKYIVNMISGGERMIYWRLTGRENLKYFGLLYGLSKEELNYRIEQLLKFVGLEDKSDEPVEGYSKGMKQRLQIARGLINDPKYIFMDEPTIGLDAPIAKEIRKKVKDLVIQENKGMLLTSHYISEIEELCDYVYVINNGLRIIEGTPRDIINKVSVAYKYLVRIDNKNVSNIEQINAFLQNMKCTYKINAVEGEYTVEVESANDTQGELISYLGSNYKILSFLTVEPKLEEAIIKLSEESKIEKFAY